MCLYQNDLNLCDLVESWINIFQVLLYLLQSSGGAADILGTNLVEGTELRTSPGCGSQGPAQPSAPMCAGAVFFLSTLSPSKAGNPELGFLLTVSIPRFI